MPGSRMASPQHPPAVQPPSSPVSPASAAGRVTIDPNPAEDSDDDGDLPSLSPSLNAPITIFLAFFPLLPSLSPSPPLAFLLALLAFLPSAIALAATGGAPTVGTGFGAIGQNISIIHPSFHATTARQSLPPPPPPPPPPL